MMTQHTSARRLAITGANSRTGQQILASVNGDAVALVRKAGDVDAHEVIADWTTSPAARAALGEADAVAHLAGNFGAPTWEDYLAGTVETTRLVAESVKEGTRIVYLSQLGADSFAENWYERAKGMAEEILAPMNATVFRISAIVGGRNNPQPFDFMVRGGSDGGPVPIAGDGAQVFRPIHIDDVVTAILLATQPGAPSGVFDLVGPQEHTMQEWVDIAHGGPTPTTRRSDLPPAIDDLLANPVTPGDPAALLAAFPELRLTEWRP
ncbi:SDR family oxidoreductase [Curtobacterium sp. SL109]|uniref:SDR family oxidoreductase n=1 Tax=Curtobacterium sp. SL109 TaxID=2994662 RepID=UPI002DD4296B|nr:NAD-dependent epimerase/dehydratase family protein [Curtobacterium sp. SL109]